MFGAQDYREEVKNNENLFRLILRDMKEYQSHRPGGVYIPEDLDTESPADELFERYSEGNRMGQFTITDFSVFDDEAQISFQDVAPLSGGGVTWKYKVTEDSIEFVGVGGIFMS